MIGVPGRSDPPRTSSDHWSSALRSVNVPATAGVTSHWARTDVQSAESSLAKAGSLATFNGPPRRKHAPLTLRVNRPAAGSSHARPCLVGASAGASAITASIGVVPQPATKSAKIMPQDEVSNAIGFRSAEPSMGWLSDSTAMRFASLARVVNDVPSSFAARADALRRPGAARSYRHARTTNEAGA